MYPTGTTLLEVAESIGTRLAKDAVAAQINGKLTDLTEAIDIDADINIITGDSADGHEVLLHSTAHLMAQAVKELFPNARVTIGPAIENRFYYDFDVENPFTDEDLASIEEKMRELAQNNYPVKRKVFSKDEAIDLFKSMDENYKVEIIQEISPEETLSAYQQDNFIDLCRGPHVPATGRIKYFKILNSSGAYWRGDENNKMLQRIYGTVFNTKKELKEYLHMLEEAKKRDHRKIGKEMQIFAFDEDSANWETRGFSFSVADDPASAAA